MTLTHGGVTDGEAFAALLQEMRDRAGLTVPEVAHRMGVEPNAVHQYFYRKRGVGGTSTMRWFTRYAEACGCEVRLTFPEVTRGGGAYGRGRGVWGRATAHEA
jgi:transcriptional regulator with XRE-family HTH domain